MQLITAYSIVICVKRQSKLSLIKYFSSILISNYNYNNNKILLYSAVLVSGSSQCALHIKNVLIVLNSGEACLKVICVFKKMGFQVVLESVVLEVI